MCTRMFLAALAPLLIAVVSAACSGDDAESENVMPGSEFGNAMPGDNPATGDGPANGGSGSGSTLEPVPGACPEGQAETSRVVPRVILVLDGSCSMSTEYGAGGPSATTCTSSPSSRWGELRSALLDPQNGVVSQLQASIEFGVVVFGTEPSCPIPDDPIEPARNNRDAVEAVFPQTPPGLYTPTGPALQWVYENMIRGDRPDVSQGPQIVILATDGEPNSCNDDETNYQPSVDAVMYGQQRDVTTYVISLANSSGEFHDHLQQLANIGTGSQNASLYEPTTPQELAADLGELIGGAVGCDIALNGSLDRQAAPNGTVTLNGEELEWGTGWTLADPRHIRLEEPYCSEFQGSAEARLFADFPCGTFQVD